MSSRSSRSQATRRVGSVRCWAAPSTTTRCSSSTTAASGASSSTCPVPTASTCARRLIARRRRVRHQHPGIGARAVRARPESLTGEFERLIYAIVTGYGLDGADADRAAYDVAAYWARAGIADSLRTPGGPLPFQRAGMGDHTVAMTGAAMISAALFDRERTGRGQVVSTSLLRQGVYTIGFDVNIALMWGRTIAAGVRETMRNPSVNNYEAK